MKNHAVISVSLPKADVEVLDRLASKAGSRSAAVRDLISRERKAQRDTELEEAYRAYYADPVNRRDKESWTRDMLRMSSWLNEGSQGGGKGGKKGRTAR